MLLLSRIAPVIVLAVIVQCTCVYGYQRVVHINEDFSDDEDFYSSPNKMIIGSGEIIDLHFDSEVDSINPLCCVYGNCSCYSLDHALTHLTSNLLLDITTDVTLTSVINALNLVNVSIIGHNNPTVNCRGAGGIHFTSCHNCIIQGITLDGCGTDNDEPGLQLTNSSDITIQKCSFQHSRGQAVALSEISGYLNIHNCKFANNSQYNGHGAIINILFSTVKNSLQSFKIQACDFSNNKGARSLIYINNKIFEHNINITISSSVFYYNQGVSVYIINQKLYLTGRILFKHNTAEDGAGIHISDHSTVLFGDNSNVTFLQNTADENGGAIFSSNNSIVVFDKNSKVMFTSNRAKFGTVYSKAKSNVTFKANCKVIFYCNSALSNGGAVFSTHSNISFENNAYTKFNNNNAKTRYYSGGAIYAKYTHVSFEGSSLTKFSNNTGFDYGGAIFASHDSIVSFEDNSTTEFSNNRADYGGAIKALHSHVSFEDNSTTEFSNNRAIHGGAIYIFARGDSPVSVSFEDNSTTKFSNNMANYDGGAISAYLSHVSFEDNSTTEFSNNRGDNGGAIIALHSHVSFEDNSTTEFSNNRADHGGAISAADSNVSFEDNSTTEFSNNSANYDGGAISAANSDVSFEGNSTTEFSNNNALSDIHAITSSAPAHIIFDGNCTVSFINDISTDGEIVYPISASIYHHYIEHYSDTKLEIIARGNFTITFNYQTVKWCTSTCLPYSGKDHYDVRIDNTGMVWCTHQDYFKCQSRNCQCKNLEDVTANITNNSLITISNKVRLSSAVNLSVIQNISIIGQNNLVVFCVNGGGLQVEFCNNLTIQDITWIGCKSALKIYNSEDVTIRRCSFLYSKRQAIEMLEPSGNVNVDYCKFMHNNNYRGHGSAIHSSSNNPSTRELTVNINNCDFNFNIGSKSIIYIKQSLEYILNHYINNSTFQNNQAISIYFSGHQNINFAGNLLFKNNEAEIGTGLYVSGHSTVTFDENSTIKFINNTADHYGAAIFLDNHSSVVFDKNSSVNFSDNYATNGTVYSKDSSFVLFKGTCKVTFNSNKARLYGAAILSSENSQITFTGNSSVNFTNNIVPNHNQNSMLGGTIFIENYSLITFMERSITMFSNNTAAFGTGIFSFYNSNVNFRNQSKVFFDNNIAVHCGVLTTLYSNVSFNDNADVIYNANKLSCPSNSCFTPSAGAISSLQGTDVILSGHSSVTFMDNTADYGSGAIVFSESTLTIQEHSTITFNNNIAKDSSGGALACYNSNITVKGNSNVTFSGNKATQSGGALHLYSMSKIIFTDNSTSNLFNNTAITNGGAILNDQSSEITFKGNSTVHFNYNKACNGGTFYSSNSSITFKEMSVTSFYHNKAKQNGGVGYFNLNSNVMFEGITVVSFNGNMAEENGGVLCSIKSDILFKNNSNVSFTDNRALDGGAISADDNSFIVSTESSVLSFLSNEAIQNGGVFHVSSSYVSFSDNASETFENNSALNGGGICLNSNSNIMFKENSYALFKNNMANTDGGAISILTDSSFEVINDAVMKFITNSAHNGGAMHFDNNNYALFSENTVVSFENNSALYGGAICLSGNSNITYKEKSKVLFKNNIADIDGGALSIFTDSSFKIMDYAAIEFNNNRAKYGGAMYFDTTHSTLVVNNHKGEMEITGNRAKFAGENIYIDLTKSCNKSCLHTRIIMGDIKHECVNLIGTPPSKLVLSDPAVCIDDDTKIECNEYLLSHVMLGEEINVPATVLDYFNHSSYKAQFLLRTAFHQNYSISGSKEFLLSNGSLSGISITGNESLTKSLNYSANIILNDNQNFEWRQISVNLTIEMIPCYLGFWQYSGIQRCDCYNASDIVYCSGSTSTIKRGYWFGSIKERPTVTFCPINYCNFTCCETSNGYYHLSPIRNNQCRSHRTGPACGSCTDGYTLSFDSTECVDVDNCTAGQTVLVILLTVIYWIAMFTLVFAIMYYKVGIGYLYSITYYYSIVDILLSQNIHASRGLYLTTTILSSFSKITPEFLGEFCLTTGMSGIDQQFIHYMHPSAVILILVIISLLARRSRRISTIISRGIIHVICLLLLLSYTSIASTSLLLMKSLKFLDINKVYTYPSPDIEYLHGRHLAYAIVAMLCTVSIVIGLPLLLTLEPFLSNKINFIKIKPLLDQFQACYKDNFRYFAGYYMICRLIVIAIACVIDNSSNDFVADYMLVIVCGVIALVHVMVKPYNNEILNKFDGIILHLIIFSAILQWLDDFTSLTVIIMAFILIILPLLSFTAMTLFLHKDDVKKIFTKFTAKIKLSNESNKSNNNSIKESETPQSKFHFITDDSKRKNAAICDV